jgi:predicted fused transcriptional regulator/phosphomethylpyrimidine kinase
MDWGVAAACKNGVPDVIYPRGGRGAFIILGEDPVDVANNIIICSNRI